MNLNSELRTIYLPTNQYALFIKYVVGNKIDLGHYVPVTDGLVVHKGDADAMRSIVAEYNDSPLGKAIENQGYVT